MHGAADAEIDVRRGPHPNFPAFAQVHKIVGDFAKKNAMRDLAGENIQPVAGMTVPKWSGPQAAP